MSQCAGVHLNRAVLGADRHGVRRRERAAKRSACERDLIGGERSAAEDERSTRPGVDDAGGQVPAGSEGERSVSAGGGVAAADLDPALRTPLAIEDDRPGCGGAGGDPIVPTTEGAAGDRKLR